MRMEQRAVLAWPFFGASLLAAGCRAGESSCTTAVCEHDAAVVEAGAVNPRDAQREDAQRHDAASEPDAVASVGGAAIADAASLDDGTATSADGPGCVADDACRDALHCNGDEHCARGACAPGTPLVCPVGSQCFERADTAVCAYAPSERFAVYLSNDFKPNQLGLVGVPLSTVNDPTWIDLSAPEVDDHFFLVADVHWAADRKRNIFEAYWTDWQTEGQSKFCWIDLTAPLPLRARRIPNLPIAELKFVAWSRDTRAALFSTIDVIVPPHRNNGIYASRFSADDMVTVKVTSTGWTDAPTFCANSELVVYEEPGGLRIAAPWDSTAKPTVVGHELVGTSIDNRWLLLSDHGPNARAYLAECALDAHAEALGPEAGGTAPYWSPDSKYLIYGGITESETGTVWRVARSSNHVPAFQFAGRAASFQPGADRLVYLATNKGSAVGWRVKDLLTNAPPVVVAIPADAENVSFGDGGTLHYSVATGSGHESYEIDSVAGARPKLIPPAPAPDLRVRSKDGKYAFYFDNQGEGSGAVTQAFIVDLSKPSASPRPLFPQALSGTLRFEDLTGDGAPVFVRHTYPVDYDRIVLDSELYLLADDFHGLVRFDKGALGR